MTTTDTDLAIKKARVVESIGLTVPEMQPGKDD
jgi:hypothetical protein